MEDPPRPLPDDVLADVLARLAPRSLAVSRCVCRDWRAVVDDRCRHLLRPDLLPLTVGGIFIQSFCWKMTPDFFARPSTTRSGRVAGRLESFVRTEDFGDCLIRIDDCCNGLLLLADDNLLQEIVVANPATRRWVCVPSYDRALSEVHEGGGIYWSYLAFDPTDVSPHYEVISMQDRHTHTRFNGGEGKKRLAGLQWPPPVYFMLVYSSRTARWEERRFALDDGDDEGLHHRRSITDGANAYGHAAYWRGVLYVHCNTHFILRINLSEDKYQVVDLPAAASASGNYEGYLNGYEGCLGKSKNGIYFATIINDTCQVLVWFLDESNGKVQWVFNHGTNMYDLITCFSDNPATQTDNPWILQDNGDSHQEFKSSPTVEVEKNLKKLDWESDDDESAVDIRDYCGTTVEEEKNVYWGTDGEGTVDIEEENTYEFLILGFHPYKEIVFLRSSRVMAYYFGSSKVQDLGELPLRLRHPDYTSFFVYTPCWLGDLSEMATSSES